MRTRKRTGRMLAAACLFLLLTASSRPATASPNAAAPARADEAGSPLGVLAPALAEFSASPLSGPAPMSVQFEDLSTGEPVSWSWTFGDGGTSTQQYPRHTYTEPGVYTVALTVLNASGSVERRTRLGYITVEEPPPPPVQAYLPALAR